MTDLFRNFPETIGVAAQTPWGIAALIIILVFLVIAILFFRKASVKMRTLIFICIIIGFLGFGWPIWPILKLTGLTTIPPPPTPPNITEFVRCLGSPPRDTIVYLEEGSHDEDIIELDKLNNRTLNIILTKNNELIGGIKINFLERNLFEIISIVNTSCQQIKEFKNTTHGPPHYIIHDYDIIEIQFSNKKYAICLGYHLGTISVNYFKIISYGFELPPRIKPELKLCWVMDLIDAAGCDREFALLGGS